MEIRVRIPALGAALYFTNLKYPTHDLSKNDHRVSTTCSRGLRLNVLSSFYGMWSRFDLRCCTSFRPIYQYIGSVTTKHLRKFRYIVISSSNCSLERLFVDSCLQTNGRDFRSQFEGLAFHTLT